MATTTFRNHALYKSERTQLRHGSKVVEGRIAKPLNMLEHEISTDKTPKTTFDTPLKETP